MPGTRTRSLRGPVEVDTQDSAPESWDQSPAELHRALRLGREPSGGSPGKSCAQTDSAQHSAPGAQGACWNWTGVAPPGQPVPAPSLCRPAGGPYTETNSFPWPFFCSAVPRLHFLGSHLSGRKPNQWTHACTVPQASPCPHLGALDMERPELGSWACWLSGLGHVCPAVALRCLESPGPRWHSGSAKQMQAQGYPCISQHQTHGRVNHLRCGSPPGMVLKLLHTWPVSIHQSSSLIFL